MRGLLVVVGAMLLAGGIVVETPAQTVQRTPAQRWFEDARFGIFLHWGIYSVLGRGEWVMHNERIPIAEYEKLAAQFDPRRFDAREWVALFKEAGARYVTITSKHHDGFAMYHSRVSRYNVVDATPFRRDPLAELAAECRRQGLKLFFYYSQLDWHHRDYYPRGRTGQFAGRPDFGIWLRYKNYYFDQVRELCTQYGEIGGLWFDGWWDRPDADWGHDELYAMIHRLQPNALIGNNHHREPFPGEDFQMFEQDLPGENTAGFNRASVSPLPLETCLTINRSWGYHRGDQNHKSERELIQTLVKAAGRNANLLLNTGPLPDGTIQPEHAARLRAIGKWLRANGESIYGTRGGPFPPGAWGASTWKGRRIYLHLLGRPEGAWQLPPLKERIRAARLLHGGSVPFTQSERGIRVGVPAAAWDPVDTIVVLELRDRPGRS